MAKRKSGYGVIVDNYVFISANPVASFWPKSTNNFFHRNLQKQEVLPEQLVEIGEPTVCARAVISRVHRQLDYFTACGRFNDLSIENKVFFYYYPFLAYCYPISESSGVIFNAFRYHWDLVQAYVCTCVSLFLLDESGDPKPCKFVVLITSKYEQRGGGGRD